MVSITPGVPIGHDGGDPDEIGPGHCVQFPVQAVRKDAVAVIVPRELRVSLGFADPDPWIFPGPELSVGSREHAGMTVGPGIVPVQAIHEGDTASPLSKESGKVQETQGHRPEIVGRKVLDPRIDQKEKGSLTHVILLKHLLPTVYTRYAWCGQRSSITHCRESNRVLARPCISAGI